MPLIDPRKISTPDNVREPNEKELAASNAALRKARNGLTTAIVYFDLAAAYAAYSHRHRPLKAAREACFGIRQLLDGVTRPGSEKRPEHFRLEYPRKRRKKKKAANG